MPLIAILIAALVFLAACSIGGEHTLRFLVDVPAVICTLTPIVAYAICKGFKPFGKGLSAMLRLPQQNQPDVEHFFLKDVILTAVSYFLCRLKKKRFRDRLCPGYINNTIHREARNLHTIRYGGPLLDIGNQKHYNSR